MVVAVLLNIPCSYIKRINESFNTINPTAEGTVINSNILKPNNKDFLNSAILFFAVCLASVGKIAIDIAIPNAPKGNCTNLLE